MLSGTRPARASSAETLGSGVDVLPPALPLPESDELPPQPVSARAVLVRVTAATAARRNGLMRRTGASFGRSAVRSSSARAACGEDGDVAASSVGGLVHPVGAVDLTGSGQVGGVDDRVRVALLGEEALSVGGVLAVEGVAADHREEVRLAAVGLGPEHPAQPLGLLLPRPEGA